MEVTDNRRYAECPNCDFRIPSGKTEKPILHFFCQNCKNRWSEVVFISADTHRWKQLPQMAKHKNFGDQGLDRLLSLKIVLDHFSRVFIPTKCGLNCENKIENLSEVISQAMEDGFPPKRMLPFLCSEHYLAHRKKRYGE